MSAEPIAETDVPADTAPASADALLRLDDITTRYGHIEVLHGLSLSVREGETVALVGANGAGKTTLLRVISGLQPATGAIHFAGVDLSRVAAALRVRHGIVQIPEGRQVFAELSVQDNLMLGAYTRNDKAAIAEDMERQYERFPILKQKRRQNAGALSGGQQQMLAMGRALMARPRLLLMDEPSMGLAPLLIQQTFDIIRELKRDGITLFVVEQNAAEALRVADRGYVLETGSIVAQGSGADLLQDDNVRAAYLGG